MVCQFSIRFDALVCDRCGLVVQDWNRALTPQQHIAKCKGGDGTAEAPARLRLGSAIKAGLDKIGVTQDRVAALVEEIGLPPSCGGCARRQEQLDEFDRRAEAWLKRAAAWWRGEAT